MSTSPPAAETQPRRGTRTICLPIEERRYQEIVTNPAAFRAALDEQLRLNPELLPPGMAQGYQLKDSRWSKKLSLMLRRIELTNGSCYSIRPSFVMPYLTARTDDVENGLFLRKFGVP